MAIVHLGKMAVTLYDVAIATLGKVVGEVCKMVRARRGEPGDQHGWSNNKREASPLLSVIPVIVF
jgi:hypothetical protein